MMTSPRFCASHNISQRKQLFFVISWADDEELTELWTKTLTGRKAADDFLCRKHLYA
jgi:hypothetical protein